MMKTFTKPLVKLCRIAAVGIFLTQSTLVTAFGQISYADDRHKPDSRKVRREAAKYARKNNAEEYTSSHLDMDMFSFRKGEPGHRPLTDEMAADAIYNSDFPIQTERKSSRKKK